MSDDHQDIVTSSAPVPEPVKNQSKPQSSGKNFIIALLLLSIMASLLSYLAVNQRLAKLERSLSTLETAVPNLPKATIDAIIALQNGENPEAATGTNVGAATVFIDDDAYFGDRSTAQFAIVEFSDFNCPYCAKFHAETLGNLLNTYVRTGKAIYVYRDYVGVGGNVTLAAAGAAECVKALAGEQAYLEVVQGLYASSGIKDVGRVKALAANYPLDEALLTGCIEEERFREEVIADTQAGQAAGVRGTPAFIIGRLAEDGSVSGINLPGAQPFAVFERVIEELIAGLD